MGADEELKGGYGYGLLPAEFHTLLADAYPNLNETTYLDHAASTPPIPSAVQAFAQSLTTDLFSNPHSLSPSAVKTGDAIDRMRGRVLKELFGVAAGNGSGSGDEGWDLVWTAGTTASLKLVGDCFPWDGSSTRYRYLKESHTSVVGVRGCALSNGARVDALDSPPGNDGDEFEGITLWAYPAQCNVTGSRLGLDLGRDLKRNAKTKGRQGKLAILVDAAAYLSTTPLDLDSIPYDEAPDFIACSFYKIFVRPHLHFPLAS